MPQPSDYYIGVVGYKYHIYKRGNPKIPFKTYKKYNNAIKKLEELNERSTTNNQ